MKIKAFSERVTKEITFPCLLQSSISDVVIFAPENGKHAIVMLGNESWEDGQYYGDYRTGEFELYGGTITLSN